MPLGSDDIRNAVNLADINWNDWREDFEFNGDPARIPTLNDPDRFRRFRHEYSLLRFKNLRVVEQVRKVLYDSDLFRDVVADQTGETLDAAAQDLSRRVRGVATERSLLSKLSAFARPAQFIAWDRFARIGVHYLSHLKDYPAIPDGQPLRSPRASPPYQVYVTYLRDFRALHNNVYGDEIRGLIPEQVDRPGFDLRVLDCCLMIVGGRNLRVGHETGKSKLRRTRSACC